MTSPRSLQSKCLKRRRRKQHTFLSKKMQIAAQRFADEAGLPKFDAKGYRNFRDWLAELRHPRRRSLWKEMAEAMGRELFRHRQIYTCDLQEEVVREVIRCVVRPRHYESDKLVSSSAYRHTTTSPSGNSLLSVFESQLDRDSAEDGPDSSCGPSSYPDPIGDPMGSNKPGNVTHEECPDLIVEGIRQNRDVNGSLTGGLPSFQELIAASLTS